jgi:hypothetical protein
VASFSEDCIPYLSVIENMGIERAPVGVFAPRSDAAAAFDALWMEVVRRAKL